MKMNLTIIKKNYKIVILTLFFAVLYGIRLFTNYPWYDELYTYYSFISRGPVYAAIHWPLPNNHVGYSVLSGFLSYFGNAAIALRGVSYLASVANIVLVYVLTSNLLASKSMTMEGQDLISAKDQEGLGILSTIAFAAVNLVHTLAIQGRGYALSTTCFILSILMILKIGQWTEKSAKSIYRYYIVYSIALALGIYVLPSSTFWVIPVCITGGLYLLIGKKYKELIKLIVFSLISAIVVLGLYVIIWMAIGSNLLSKTEGSGYTGVYQLTILKQAPLRAISTGIDYMLASPYIQSVDRAVVVRELLTYLKNLFNQFYPSAGYIMLVFMLIAFAFAFVKLIKNKDNLFYLLIAVNIISVPILLIIQSKQPYLRVFSYFGVIVALSVVMFIKLLPKYKVVVTYSLALLFFVLLFTGAYNIPIADRENDIHDALEALEQNGTGVDEINNILYMDDYQKYVIKYYYDIEINEVYSIDEAEYLMLPNEEMNGVWPYLFSENDFNRNNIQKTFEEMIKTDKYTIYRKYK